MVSTNMYATIMAQRYFFSLLQLVAMASLCCAQFVVDCGDLNNPNNGVVNLTGTTIGSVATYRCDEGFTVTILLVDQGSTSQRTCQPNAQWSGRQPMCDIIPRIGFGRAPFTVSERTRGLFQVCAQVENGPLLRVITIDLELTEGAQQPARYSSDYQCDGCSRVSPVTQVIRGLRIGRNNLACARISITDDDHYELTENFLIRVRPQSDIIVATSASVSILDDDVVTIGFRPASYTIIESSGSVEVCIVLLSGTLDEFVNLTVMAYTVDFSATVDDRLTENDEVFYIVISDAPRVRFDPESFASITIVDINCGNLENPLNGQVFLSGTDLQSEATYNCDEGFALSENNTRICQENEQWSNREPVCLVSCGDLASPVDGAVMLNGTTVGVEAAYVCSRGFQVVGNASRTCEEDGMWSGVEPLCDAVDCGNLQPPSNGNITLNGTTFGFEANYSCNSNFQLLGEAARVCQENGAWTSEEPTCELIDCGVLLPPVNGNITVNGTIIGSEATYSCNMNFQLVGTARRICQGNGIWSSGVPICQANCGGLPPPSNGEVVLNGTNLTSVAVYTCIMGYQLVGSEVRICQGNGLWSGGEPSCIIVDCGSLPPPTNGDIMLGETTFGSEALYSCQEGFELTGSRMRACMADGQWSASEPTCTEDSAAYVVISSALMTACLALMAIASALV